MARRTGVESSAGRGATRNWWIWRIRRDDKKGAVPHELAEGVVAGATRVVFEETGAVGGTDEGPRSQRKGEIRSARSRSERVQKHLVEGMDEGHDAWAVLELRHVLVHSGVDHRLVLRSMHRTVTRHKD